MKSPLLFQNQPAIEISNGQDKVIVCPDHGARILKWEHAGREIIPWPDDADWNRYRKVRGGDPVLFPFVARHYVNGKNEFWRDGSGDVRPMPQHGFALDAKFTLIETGDENELRMRLTDSETTRPLYPFGFRFDVVVSLLTASRLEVRFETTNTGETALPYYAGHHFYFAIPHDKRADWNLHLPCQSWGERTEDGGVLREKAGTAEFTLDNKAAIDRFHIQPTEPQITLSNVQTGQQLILELNHPGSIPWYAVTTWTEFPASNFYCIEPWLGLPNAIHHGEGLSWLTPGATEIATVVLDGGGW
jgi:galactose mutarotase-like enzyme